MPMLDQKLQLAKDMESLQRLANLDHKQIAKSSTEQLCKSAKKLFDEAQQMYKLNNEEKAFVYFFKFIDLVIYLKKKPDFESNPISKFLAETALKTMPIASKLKSSLSQRYQSLHMAEKEKEKESVRAEKEKEDEMKETPPPVTIKTDSKDDCSISAAALLSILRDPVCSLLLIDTRSPEEFSESHIKHSSCVNVPKEILTPGLTAQQLEKQLPTVTSSKWYQKNTVDHVILIDWDTATTKLPDTHPLVTLEKAIMKWDLKNPLTKKPVILIGGYKDWVSRYPMYSTKAIDVFSVDAWEKPALITDLSSVDYPDLDEAAREELGPKTFQQNKKLLLDQSQKNIIQNGWVIDPVGSGGSSPQPSVNRSAKPLNSTKDFSEESSTSAANSQKGQIPEFNRSLKPSLGNKNDSFTKALNDEEKAVKESLSVTERELDKEKEFAQLRLRKELEAEETMRLELQKQEEHLLESLKRLHMEKQEQEKKYLALKEENTQMKKLLENQKTDEQREKEADIQSIDFKKKNLQKEVERMRQERKQKEKKEAENKAKCHSASEYRTEADKNITGKYRNEGEYTQPLKDASSSSDGHGRGLTRSYSSPNIAQMVAEDDKKRIPTVDRSLKPKFDYTVNPNFEFKMRNLNAIFGNIPGRPVTGLRNLGNTCYMNSTIQCLSNTELIADYFNEGRYMKDIKRHSKQGTNGEIVEEFAYIIRFLWAGQYRFFSPKDFKNTASKYIPMCVGYEQQDSHEFLVVLMDKLHGDLNQGQNLAPLNLDSVPDAEATDRFWEHHKLRNTSIMSQTFEGFLKSTLTCLSCGKTSNSYEVFSCLSLPISSSRCHLKDSLQTFLKTEKMSGEGAWNCPNCRKKKDAEKSLIICKLPDVLIIQLKRFSYDGMWRKKIQSFVDFPMQFEMQSSYDRSRHYSLCGIVNHFGYLEGGHYTAYCKNPTSGKWYKYDDQEVSEINYSDIVTSAAYLLFYCCQKSRL